MQVILQLFLIAILLEGLMADMACVHFYSLGVRIPDDSPYIMGVNKSNWYTHINWLDNPAGDLTLTYKSEYQPDPNVDKWYDFSSGSANVYETGNTESADWARFVRKALALNHPNVKIPGKVKVSQQFTPGNKCFWINFVTPYYPTYTYRIFFEVTDDDGHLYLIGPIKIPPKSKK